MKIPRDIVIISNKSLTQTSSPRLSGHIALSTVNQIIHLPIFIYFAGLVLLNEMNKTKRVRNQELLFDHVILKCSIDK